MILSSLLSPKRLLLPVTLQDKRKASNTRRLLAFKKTNLAIHQPGRIRVQFGKIHHLVQHSDPALSILRKREKLC